MDSWFRSYQQGCSIRSGISGKRNQFYCVFRSVDPSMLGAPYLDQLCNQDLNQESSSGPVTNLFWTRGPTARRMYCWKEQRMLQGWK